MENDKLLEVESLALLFKRLNQNFTRRIIEKLKKAGYDDFTQPQINVLGIVVREDGIHLTKIAENLAISKQGIKEIVDYLEDRKYLKRVKDPNDLRAKNVKLTKLGQKMIFDARKASEEIRDEYKLIIGEVAFEELEKSIKLIISNGF